MRCSISNLTWGPKPVVEVAPALNEIGIQGLEIAPSVLWPDSPYVDKEELSHFREFALDHGLRISGIQSLLYGHPELQLFDSSTWAKFFAHMQQMVWLAATLGAEVAVFGSPRNRVKGKLSNESAMLFAAEFFSKLVPVLETHGVVLALEPNAQAYGADFLTTYQECVLLTDLVESEWIQPQVDTGCLDMEGQSSTEAILFRTPAHVHISSPNLAALPGTVDHKSVRAALDSVGYQRWVVLEMLPTAGNFPEDAVENAAWLAQTYGDSIDIVP